MLHNIHTIQEHQAAHCINIIRMYFDMKRHKVNTCLNKEKKRVETLRPQSDTYNAAEV